MHTLEKLKRNKVDLIFLVIKFVLLQIGLYYIISAMFLGLSSNWMSIATVGIALYLMLMFYIIGDLEQIFNKSLLFGNSK